MKSDSSQITLANLFIYNTDYGLKEGREEEKIFYFHPYDEKVEMKVRTAGFCAGIVQFAETFQASRPCEFVHTEKVRMVFYKIDEKFWMIMSLNVPVAAASTTSATASTTTKEYDNDQVADQIYMSILKQAYSLYKVFNGNLCDNLAKYGIVKLKENLKSYFDEYIEKRLNVHDCNIMNTFNGIQFMSLDRSMYLKIQCLLNLLEEKVPLVDKTVVMHNDQLIWNGLEQDDIACIYNYLKDLVVNNLEVSSSNAGGEQLVAKFLIDGKPIKNLPESKPTTSTAVPVSDNLDDNYFEFKRVFLGKSSREQYYLIPYNLSKLTFFIFIRVDQSFKLSLLKEIDEILASSMIVFLQEISKMKSARFPNVEQEKEIKYIYFNCLNLAQKSTIASGGRELPKYVVNLLSQLSKDLKEACDPSGEIFIKSGRDYWLACKKSDLREVYVVVSQKNANLTLIDEEVKQLCSVNFSNIFFME
jgi:hypothetical protein